MADKLKKSIYLTGKLIDTYDECITKKRVRSFSGRVSDIVDRYEILIGLAKIPELNDTEKVILGKTILGSVMDKYEILYMPDNIRDTDLEGAEELAKRIEPLDNLQRMALIEALKI
ncbi:hypothetical protein [Streptococcus agalactiae]